MQGRRHRDPVGMADVAASGRNRGHDSVWVFWPRPARKDDPLGIVPGSYGWRVGFRIRFARARFESNGRRKAAVRRSRESEASCFAAGKSLWRACGRTRKSHDLSRRSRPILRSLAEAMWLEATPMSHALRRRAAHYGVTGRRDACLPVGCA